MLLFHYYALKLDGYICLFDLRIYGPVSDMSHIKEMREMKKYVSTSERMYQAKKWKNSPPKHSRP